MNALLLSVTRQYDRLDRRFCGNPNFGDRARGETAHCAVLRTASNAPYELQTTTMVGTFRFATLRS